MKTYLVPTDYSDVSENAVNYAIALAKKEQAKIVLFHVFQIPYPVAHDTFMPIISVDELEKDALVAINSYKDKLLETTNSQIQIECAVTPGFVAEGVESYIKHHPVDLIIMGITGGGKMKEIFVGSNATAVAKNSGKNVLIVPADAKYKDVHKIGFATDFELEGEEKIERQVKHFADLWKSNIVAINISTNVDLNTPEKAGVVEKVKQHFSGYSFTVDTVESDNISEEIEHYVVDHNCDWLMIVPKHTGIFDQIFNRSLTKQLAYHLHIPILAVNELAD